MRVNRRIRTLFGSGVGATLFIAAQFCCIESVSAPDPAALSERLYDEALRAEANADSKVQEQKLLQACDQAKLLGEQSLHFKCLLRALASYYCAQHKYARSIELMTQKLKLDEAELGGLFVDEILDDLQLLYENATRSERWKDALSYSNKALGLVLNRESKQKYLESDPDIAHSQVNWNKKSFDELHVRLVWQIFDSSIHLGDQSAAEACRKQSESNPLPSYSVVSSALSSLAKYYFARNNFGKGETALLKAIQITSANAPGNPEEESKLTSLRQLLSQERKKRGNRTTKR